MALVGVGVQVIPLMGAAVFLPSTIATALRLPTPSERRIENDREMMDAILELMSPQDGSGMMIGIGKDLGSVRAATKMTAERDEYGQDDDEEDEDDDYVAGSKEIEDKLSFENDESGSTEAPRQRPVGSLDTWSVVWYCGMFAAFTSLFLIMPCSQVLCKAGLAAARRDPRLRPRPPLLAPSSGMHYGTPPPPYKQFAPPPYESLFTPDQAQSPHLEKVGVYIIPVRADAERRVQPPPVDLPPPPYSEIQIPANTVAPISIPAQPDTVPSVA